MGTISQDHAKLDSDAIADAIKLLVEADPSIKVKSVITEVQSRFNYTVSYRKAWLAKQKAVAKVFGDWKVSYQTLPIWLKVMTVKMSRSHVQIKMLPVYRKSEKVQGVRVLHRIFWSLYPCIVAFRYCKSLVQVDGTHLYGKYKGALSGCGCTRWKPKHCAYCIAIVEGETADEWEFFLTNLRRYVVTVDGVGIISDRHTSINAAIARSDGAWSPPRAWHMYCIRHIGSNFLRRFKTPYLHKLVVNTGYSRTKQEYNKNYQRFKERGETYTQWCNDIGVERWVLPLMVKRIETHSTTLHTRVMHAGGETANRSLQFASAACQTQVAFWSFEDGQSWESCRHVGGRDTFRDFVLLSCHMQSAFCNYFTISSQAKRNLRFAG
ncbi:uncharacterized protein [Arachis hypogaea]|uniref:uncharacterized protein n=1 Tax=Arachis hypogaea TaxID=3818 RepID=UPI003B216863